MVALETRQFGELLKRDMFESSRNENILKGSMGAIWVNQQSC